MLVLSRKVDEIICIGDDIRIKVVQIGGNKVRLGIEAPSDVRIRRGELPGCGSFEFDLPFEIDPCEPACVPR